MGLAALLRGARPWPVPADRDWRAARFCVVDLETTGLDLRKDEIVSIGAVRVEEGRVTSKTFYEEVRPSRPVSEQAMSIHTLTHDELATASPVENVLPRFREFARDSVLVAHAAWVEQAFLDRQLRTFGERVPEPLVDTAVLARILQLAPESDAEPSLEGLARALDMPVHAPHHALGDAVTTAGLLLLMCTRLERQRGRLRVSDLRQLSVRRRARPSPR